MLYITLDPDWWTEVPCVSPLIERKCLNLWTFPMTMHAFSLLSLDFCIASQRPCLSILFLGPPFEISSSSGKISECVCVRVLIMQAATEGVCEE